MVTSTETRTEHLRALSQQIRRWIIRCTSNAGSGHPTSALSAVELMVELLFDGYFRFDLNQPENAANARLIFSKGHASPRFYALWAAAGQIKPHDLMSYREFGSNLEGHPTSRFPRTEADEGGHHGKPVDEDLYDKIMLQLGEPNESIRREFLEPIVYQPHGKSSRDVDAPSYSLGDNVATRDAYGNALVRLAAKYPHTNSARWRTLQLDSLAIFPRCVS